MVGRSGFENRPAMLGDWVPPSPSPRTLFAPVLDADLCASQLSNPPEANIKKGLSFTPSVQPAAEINGERTVTETGVAEDQVPQSSALCHEQSLNSREGLVERMAARTGFDAPRLSTESIRSSHRSSNTDVRSAYLTIPPGLSPASLLEPPSFLSNEQAEPSPRTPYIPFIAWCSMFTSESPEGCKDNFFDGLNASMTEFKAAGESGSSAFNNAASKSSLSAVPQWCFPSRSLETSTHSQNSVLSQNIDANKVQSQNNKENLVSEFPRSMAEKNIGANTVPVDAGTSNTAQNSVPSQITDANKAQDLLAGFPRTTEENNVGDNTVPVGAEISDTAQNSVPLQTTDANIAQVGNNRVNLLPEFPRSMAEKNNAVPVRAEISDTPQNPGPYQITGANIVQVGNNSVNLISEVPRSMAEKNIGAETVTVRAGISASAQNSVPQIADANIAQIPNNRVNPLAEVPRKAGKNGRAKKDLTNTRAKKVPMNSRTNKVPTSAKKSDAAVGRGEPSKGVQQREGGDQQEDSVAASGVVGSADSQDDGYPWRKYGQKVVKGTEYPRSYYKCMHPFCQARKKVERSGPGFITAITYQGSHIHPPSSVNRRASGRTCTMANDMQPHDSEQCRHHTAAGNGDAALGTKEKETLTGIPPDPRHDNPEVPTSASADPDRSKLSTPLQAQIGPQSEAGDSEDSSSSYSSTEDDSVSHGSASVGYEGKGDESESKRRKIEAFPLEMSQINRPIRQPRVVVQTTSEVDLLDDGYRWRKYGQKVVKGNPNPRSYYKCTNTGCKVRKHVERACHDLKAVITTYEGKHNHEVPAPRNISQANVGASNVAKRAADGGDAMEIQAQVPSSNLFQGPHEIPAMLDSPTTSFNFHGYGADSPAFSPGRSFAMLQPGLMNLPMASNPFLGEQQSQGNDTGFVVLKEFNAAGIASHIGLNVGAGELSLYHQLMSRLQM